MQISDEQQDVAGLRDGESDVEGVHGRRYAVRRRAGRRRPPGDVSDVVLLAGTVTEYGIEECRRASLAFSGPLGPSEWRHSSRRGRPRCVVLLAHL